jgi:hypothetical protein
MIIKSLSLKSMSAVQRLVKYIFKEEKMMPLEKATRKSIIPAYGVKYTERDIRNLYAEREDSILLGQLNAFKGTMQTFIQEQLMQQKGKIVVLNAQVFKQNLRGRNFDEYVHEFAVNDKGKLHTRNGGNIAIHNLISFKPSDTQNLSNEIIRDLVEKYISLRSPRAIFLGGVHTSEKHVHIHLLQSAVDCGTGLSNRISRTQFNEIKVALQEYQLTHYGTLESLPEHGKGGREHENVKKEYQKYIFAAERCQNESVKEVARTTYQQSTSVADFMDRMNALGHTPYYRNGSPQGVLGNGKTKYRLSRLFDKKELEALDAKQELIQRTKEELHTIRSRGRANARGMNAAYKKWESEKEKAEKLLEEKAIDHEEFEKSAAVESMDFEVSEGTLTDAETDEDVEEVEEDSVQEDLEVDENSLDDNV